MSYDVKTLRAKLKRAVAAQKKKGVQLKVSSIAYATHSNPPRCCLLGAVNRKMVEGSYAENAAKILRIDEDEARSLEAGFMEWPRKWAMYSDLYDLGAEFTPKA